MRIPLLATIPLAGLFCISVSLSAQVHAPPAWEAKEKATQHASSDWQASLAANKRVEAGDKQALKDFAVMDPVVAVPFLAYYAKRRSTDTEAAAIAVATLKKVRGIRAYFRPRIAELHNHIGGDFDTIVEFETLVLISTKEAAAAAAPFLFDDSASNNPEPHSDYSVSPIRYQAVSALMDMKLPDAPTNKPSIEADDEDIQKWRAWWTAHKAEYEN